ncbi:RNA recognition motif 2-domain-containing protein [Trametes elegans]|nr:RNA recognition motif 2-domain-containing protein [Trametes elegans]
MEMHTIPFPITHHAEDPVSFAAKRPAAAARLHSTPSLPNLGLPHNYAPLPSFFPPQGPARHRPHLRPLDLASSPSASPTKRVPSFEHLRRPPTLLTPPLTPSSSFNSSNDTPATPPEYSSPLRWASALERDRALAAPHFAYSTSLQNLMSAPTSVGGGNAGYLTPTSARSRSLSSDDGSGFAHTLSATPDVTNLASGLASAEITPRDERTFVLDGQSGSTLGTEFEECSSETPSRLLVVRHIPQNASSNALLEAFSGMGDVKGILARFQAGHGVIILAFYDTRHTMRALRQITGHTFAALDDARLDASFVAPGTVEKLTGKSDFLMELDASFYVTVDGRSVVQKDVQNMLASFGDLASFSTAGSDPSDQTYHVEFWDCRDAKNAYKALNNRTILGARLTLVSSQDALEHPVEPMPRVARSSSPDAALQRDLEGRTRPRSVSASGGVGTPNAVKRLGKAKEDHGRRPSNDLFFDAVGKSLESSHHSPSRPRSISVSAEVLTPTLRMQPPASGYYVSSPHYPYSEPSYGYPHPATIPAMYNVHGVPAYPYSVYPPEMGIYGSPADAGAVGYWIPAAPPPASVEYALRAVPRGAPYQPPVARTTPPRARPPTHSPEISVNDLLTYSPFGDDVSRPASVGERTPDTPHGSQRVPGPKSGLDIANIESGVDTRTTLMIKNIPNKMSDKDLFNFINAVCPRRFDFMYLRMDFNNGCNVGYGFVNFITVQDLLRFVKTQLGVKWNMYSSEKVLQISYATLQGKEALVEKFKNSPIMKERESWRPKIFYSDGPNVGLPEPFPPPTHLRRMERSQHNRGALFVPGAPGGGGLYHHRPHPPRMSPR